MSQEALRDVVVKELLAIRGPLMAAGGRRKLLSELADEALGLGLRGRDVH